MNGTIKKIVSDKGFGFIRNASGQEFFFHKQDLVNQDDFDILEERTSKVEFEDFNSAKGPRARNVKVL